MSINNIKHYPINVNDLQTRKESLLRLVPDFFTNKYKNVLYIGANNGEFTFYQEFLNAKQNITIVEFDKTYYDVLKKDKRYETIHADIRKFQIDKKFDAIMWYHGPEHILQNEIPPVLKYLETICNGVIVLQCPWGKTSGEGAHISHNDYPFFENLGYTTEYLGEKDCEILDNAGSITSVKYMNYIDSWKNKKVFEKQLATNISELNSYPQLNDTFIKNKMDDFLNIYKNRPIQNNHGGGLAVNLFDVYCAFTYVKPKYIIESGIFQGQGTWLLEQILPNSKIVSIDPFLEQRKYISNKVKYTTTDFLNFTNDNISKERAKETIIYFDDHQDQYKRLMHAYNLGFKHLLFDDNYPEFRGKRHLTLQACLNNKADPGFYIPPNAKEDLFKAIKTYHIFKPIFKWTEPITMEVSYIEQEPLFIEYDEKYKIFYDSMHNYRWSTYVELK